MFFFQPCWFPLFFICHSSSFSVIQVNVDVKLLWKERVLSFTTYAFSCCISPLEFVLFLGLKTIKNSSFYGGNVLHVLVLFFFIFSLPLISTLVPACISHNLTAATKFSCCSSNQKKCLSVISRYSCLSLLSRWASLAWNLLSCFLFLSLINQICGLGN